MTPPLDVANIDLLTFLDLPTLIVNSFNQLTEGRIETSAVITLSRLSLSERFKEALRESFSSCKLEMIAD